MLGQILEKTTPVQNYNASAQAGADDGGFLSKLFMSSKLGRNYYTAKAAKDQLRRQQELQARLPEIMASGDPSSALMQLAQLDPSYVDDFVSYQANQPIRESNLALLNARLKNENKPSKFDRQDAFINQELEAGNIDKDEAANLRKIALGFGTTGDLPSNVREFQYYSNLPPDRQKEYLNVKRSSQVIDLGGSFARVDPRTGEAVPIEDKTLAPEQRPETKQAQAQATAMGTAKGEGMAGFDKAVLQAEQAVDNIDALLKDKDLEAVTGGFLGLRGRQSSIAPLGEAQRRLQPKIDQLSGSAFLQAREELKGAGTLTDFEGKKGEQAIARLEQAQEPEDFRAALKDLRDLVKESLEAKRKSLGVGAKATAPKQKKIPRYNPETGLLE